MDGFLRPLQAGFTAFVIFVIALLVVYFVMRWWIALAKRADTGFDEVTTRVWLNRITGLLVVLAVVAMVAQTALMAPNRIPRSDVDGSGVYNQMDTLTGHK